MISSIRFKSRQIVKAGNLQKMVLPILTVVSFGTAFLRDVLFAKQLGAGLQSDAVWLALMIPAIFEQVFGGPLRDALIARLSTRPLLGNQIHIVVLVPTLIVSVAVLLPLWMLQDTVGNALTPGWSLEARLLGIHIIAIGLLMIPGHTIYYSQWAISASIGRFSLAHSRSIWLNLAAIAACLIYPQDPFAIIWGMVGGTILHAIAMEILLLRNRPKALDKKNVIPPSKSSTGLRHLITFAICAIAPQICVLLERSLASQISQGSITHLSIAFRLSTIMMSITVASFIVPIYANLERMSGADKRDFWRVIAGHLSWISLLILPSCSIFLALSEEITRFLFLRGEFEEADVLATAAALKSYIFGVPFMCLILIFTRALLALRAALYPVVAAGMMLLSYLVLVYGVELNDSVELLAAAFSFAQFICASVLFGFLLFQLEWRTVMENMNYKFIISLVFASIAIYYFLYFWPFRSYIGLAFGGCITTLFFAAIAFRWRKSRRT